MRIGSRVRTLREIELDGSTDELRFVLTAGSVGEIVKIYPADDSMLIVKFAGREIPFWTNEIGQTIEEIR